MEVGVEGIGQVELLDQQPTGAQAAEAPAAHLVSDIVMDVAIGEQAATLFLPLPLAETTLDAALAVAQPLAYRRLHLKTLAHSGDKASHSSCLFPGSAEEFQGYSHIPPPRGAGDTLVLGLALQACGCIFLT